MATLATVSGRGVQVWRLSVHGRHHRVEVLGSFSRTVRWYVDDRLVAAKSSADDHVRLVPGDRLKEGGPATETPVADPPDVGALEVRFTALGRTRRVTWHPAEPGSSAVARALRPTGGLDLDPEPGSPAALREERIRRHPRRYAAVAVAGGVAKVVLPLLVGLLLVRLTVSLPWPDWDLPSIPWPEVDLPSIPWPEVDLPDWQVPGWLDWLLERANYVWPVVLAWILVRRELRRRRQQDQLKARLRAEADEDQGPTAD